MQCVFLDFLPDVLALGAHERSPGMRNASRSGAQALPAQGKSAQPAQNHRSGTDHPLRTGITATGIPSRPLPWGGIPARGKHRGGHHYRLQKKRFIPAREPFETAPVSGYQPRSIPARTEWTVSSLPWNHCPAVQPCAHGVDTEFLRRVCRRTIPARGGTGGKVGQPA